MSSLNIVEASIEDLQDALSSGLVTSVDLAARYLHRISAHDCRGVALNAIPVLKYTLFDDAAASDDRRASGGSVRHLDGIPFTAKDSYKVAGQTTAAGSPAFSDLVAIEDAYLVDVVRKAGGVLMGRTNMPPAACGGMQRGIYGRAENPYNPAYLAAAFASGSSNGSGASTAASMASFGLGSETVSSGRSPASNNGLVAYTPSKGWLSCRGLWPLYPTCDVPVPHTRTVKDMLAVVDVLRTPDPVDEGDFWRMQQIVKLPPPWANAPSTLREISSFSSLAGVTIAVPNMYIGGPTPAGTKPVVCNPEVIQLWERAAIDLQALGAVIKYLPDFPAVTAYENPEILPKGCPRLPENWVMAERGRLIAHAWNDFIKSFKDSKHPDIFSVDTMNIYPDSLRTEPEMRHFERANAIHFDKLTQYARKDTLYTVEGLDEAVKALEQMRKILFEDWLDLHGCTCAVFPAAGDIGPANADSDFEGAALAWRNGVHYSTGNRAIRHLGIPTVSVTMGMMEKKQMPMSLTFAGKAFDDVNLLRWANAYEMKTHHRVAPKHTPQLDTDVIHNLYPNGADKAAPRPQLEIGGFEVVVADGDNVQVNGHGTIKTQMKNTIPSLEVTIDGSLIASEKLSISSTSDPSKYSFQFQAHVPKPIRRTGLDETRAPVARDQTMCVLVARAVPGGRPTGWLGLH